MFSILISEKGGETKRMEFDRPEITIGRVAGNDIVLPRNNISKRHSRIVFKDGKFIVVDLKSTNGTFVNGRKITGPLVVKGSDKIYVGDFIVTIEEGTGAATSSTSDLDSAGAAEGGGLVPHLPRRREEIDHCRRCLCAQSQPAWTCRVVMRWAIQTKARCLPPLLLRPRVQGRRLVPRCHRFPDGYRSRHLPSMRHRFGRPFRMKPFETKNSSDSLVISLAWACSIGRSSRPIASRIRLR